jgi:hypothetical protein
LESTDIILRTFSGEKLSPMGVNYVQVKHSNQKERLPLYVVQKGGAILFGRVWLRKIRLDCTSINKISMQGNIKEKVAQVLQNFSTVFQENLGSVTGIQANLILKDDAKPVFTKARPLPYVMRPKVEKELDRLEQEGVIFKVPTSDWATPIVPIVKQLGDVRICRDFKVTINPQLQIEQYSLVYHVLKTYLLHFQEENGSRKST